VEFSLDVERDTSFFKFKVILPLIYIPLALGALSFGVWQ